MSATMSRTRWRMCSLDCAGAYMESSRRQRYARTSSAQVCAGRCPWGGLLVLILGSTLVIAKGAFAHIGPLTLAALRYGVAADTVP